MTSSTHYEMLWDCPSCGTPKLLGKTHRRCPNCGAPQDPTKRYFPKPGEEVEAAGHVFVGADWHCASCTTPNSKAAQFCVNCGMPRDGNAEVKKLGELGPPVPAPVTVKRSRVPYVVGAVVVALAFAVGVGVCWQKSVSVTVERHAWTRDIDVERLGPKAESAWCDSMPSDAYSVSRSREQRSTRQIPDGQDCHDVSVDNGDGTFHKEQRCSTRYRSEPVYDDKCRYMVNRWQTMRTAHAEGASVSPGPAWPSTSLSRPGSCLGCEREGARHERLTLALVDRSSGKRYSCDVDDRRWRALVDGVLRPMKVRVVTGGAVCSSLTP